MLFMAEEQAAERLPNEQDAGDIMWSALWRLPLQKKKEEIWADAHSGWNVIWNGLTPSRNLNAESRRRERKNDNSCPMVLKWTYPPWRPRHEREEEKQFIAIKSKGEPRGFWFKN